MGDPGLEQRRLVIAIIETDQNAAFADEVAFLRFISVDPSRHAHANGDVAVACHYITGARKQHAGHWRIRAYPPHESNLDRAALTEGFMKCLER